MFQKVWSTFERGLVCSQGTVFCKKLLPGRTSNEKRCAVYLENNEKTFDLFDVVFFSGFKPWYHPWIEVMYNYDFMDETTGNQFDYFDSEVEQSLILFFFESLPPAGKLFVSYECDNETRRGLMIDIPAQLTRLGFLLFLNGFTWFKDWYFPEGGNEGGQKLQAEKPLTDKDRRRQWIRLKNEIISYKKFKDCTPSLSLIEGKALKRARFLLDNDLL